MQPRFAFGIAAAGRPGMDRLGPEVEQLGYDELWSNDTRRGSGLDALAAAAGGTDRLRLAVGVIALSEAAPEEIAARVHRTGLGTNRLTVGVGSGSSRLLAVVRDGVSALRRELPSFPIGVAAVGPRMCRLAGEVADGVVLNWALPERLAWASECIAEGATRAHRARPRIVAYVRVAIGPGAPDRLRAEFARYARRNRLYAAYLAEHPDEPIGVALERPNAAALAEALDPYRSVVDTLVVRGLPSGDGVDDWLAIARVAAETG